MELLLVAHPDDEVIWFDPTKADKILIVFSARDDRPWFDQARRKALQEHPLKDQITLLGLRESNYWRDLSKKNQHDENFQKLCEILKEYTADKVITHKADGEYGHQDHILVHQAATQSFDCPIEFSGSFNQEIYDKAKEVYLKHKVWTWH